jgi:hypothetical protein
MPWHQQAHMAVAVWVDWNWEQGVADRFMTATR